MKRIRSLCFLAIASAALLLPSCTPKPTAMRIGYIQHVSGLPFFVAQEKGYFKAEGLDVTFTQLGYREFMDALLAGKVDVITPTSFPSLFGVENQSPGLLKFFATGGEKKDGGVIYGMVVRSDAPLSALTDLKGKKIGVTDPLTTLNLKLILKGVGLDPDKDVSIIQVDRTVGVAALISKQVDAFILSEPDLTTSMEKGGLKVIDSNMRAKYIMDPYWSGAAATTATFAQKNPVAMKRLFKALDKAIDLIRSQPAEARALFPKYTALSDQESQKVGLYFFAKTTEEVDMQAIQTLADQLVSEGIIKKAVDAKGMYIDAASLK